MPWHIVIVDNPGSHKVADVREAIAARAATLRFLPPYSLHLNPIERVFAKLKTLLQQAELPTRERPWNKIASTLHRFPSAECQI